MVATVHTLKVTLRGVKPPIWRRIEVASEITLAELSTVLEAAMGWFGGHLHAFETNGVTYEPPDPEGGLFRPTADEAEHRLNSVLTSPTFKMRWGYDFGDGWQHTIVVEAIEPADDNASYPRCINGRRACPPEDCGGPWGFEELIDAVADPIHPRHNELAEWLPDNYDPAHFDANEITNDMQAPRAPIYW